VDRVNQGKAAVCGHNVAMGREAQLPHIIGSAPKPQRVVVVGGGPGGMEAARICAERGHEVILHEATDQLGGQIALAAKGMIRRQIWGVADWLATEIERLGVDVRLNSYGEAEDIMAAAPDAVIVATGGWPPDLAVPGAEYVISAWDVLGGEARVRGEVVLLDEIGDQSALVSADVLSRAGCKVHLVTPDRMVAHDLGPTNSAVVLRALVKQGVRFSCFQELAEVAVEGARRRVKLRHVLTGESEERVADAVISEHGCQPMDELYFDLKPHSRNLGQLDHAALIAGQDPFVDTNREGQFWLARVGDVVAGRNIHAAMYDAMRVCVTL
jgi:NADPH-dependent 2,4-dienoyl-CoA reductase/sulfur reductase-like enzyme